MKRESALALVTLAELPHVGERRLERVWTEIERRGLDPARALALPPAVLAHDFGVPPAACVRLASARVWHLAHCRALLAQLDRAGAIVCRRDEQAYPRRWREHAAPPPPLAYLYGESALLSRPTLALLTSRAVSEPAVTAIVQIVRRAAADGLVLAVGGMKTTHRIAAVAIRACGAPRVVVLDRGLFAAFRAGFDRDPFGFGPGRALFDRRATLVLSCFRPHDHAVPRNGRRRDQLIAALGDVVVAASARPGGEVERTCLRALDRGQCVLSWQGQNEALLAAGARPLDEVELGKGLRRFVARP